MNKSWPQSTNQKRHFEQQCGFYFEIQSRFRLVTVTSLATRFRLARSAAGARVGGSFDTRGARSDAGDGGRRRGGRQDAEPAGRRGRAEEAEGVVRRPDAVRGAAARARRGAPVRGAERRSVPCRGDYGDESVGSEPAGDIPRPMSKADSVRCV